MHKRFDHQAIEKKWQENWKESGIYDAGLRDKSKEKEYVLVEWPYPSGNLHIGHWYAFAVPDIYVRYKRMMGKQVLYPMGFDAFGLPAENAAIKRNINPREWTESNIEFMKGQLQSMGNAFSWNKTTSSTDPEYYKWTQWMFGEFFKNDIAYRGEGVVNWCPGCHTVIANEQVLADGTCERSGDVIEKKRMPQWMIRITDFADELLDGLETVDWPEHIKEAQRQWIGRSKGAEIDFEIKTTKKSHYVILHGFTGTADGVFIPWLKSELEKQGHTVETPNLPNTHEPVPTEQAEYVLNNCRFDENTILIGHSLGATVALKVAERLSTPLEKLVLIAGFLTPDFEDHARNFESKFDWIFDFERIKKNSREIVILSDESDTVVGSKHGEKLQDALGGTLVEFVATNTHVCGDEEPIVLKHCKENVTVFTTRPDTLFGATYLVLAPEHPFVEKYKDQITNWDEVTSYVQTAKQKSDIERGDNTKEKTGVKLEGITAKNPANGEEIPVYIADYVLAGYGTGAIMAVPAHDERDNAFARKFGLPVKQVVAQIEPENVIASGLIIRTTEDKYLYQRRDKDAPTNAGGLALFGGAREGAESIWQTVVRETKEELLFDLEKHSTGFSLVKFHERTDGNFLALFFVDNVAFDSLTLCEGAEIFQASTIEDLRTAGASEFLQSTINLAADNIITEKGNLIHSADFDGMLSEEAKIAITEKVGGRMTNTYRLRDWSIGRQRYWGVPIPIVYDPEGKAHAIPKEHLPWTLPEDVDFTPTGEPPLAKSRELKERTERIFGAGWTPEVETMDTFVDSSWYFLRYIDNKNDNELSSKEAQDDWMQVDMYFGGAEHTTMHLLYSRLWQRALKRLGLAEHAEPYQMRINRGLILGPDGNKMSKSKGNVIDPDEQVKLVGADTVKMYLAFMGPYQGANYPWDLGGIAGLRRFLERVYGLSAHITDTEPKSTLSLLHKTIKKVGSDIAEFKFNTAVSAMMIFVNQAEKEGLSKESYLLFLRVLAPFAPHLTEELWHDAGNSASIHGAEFPAYDSELAKDDMVTIGVQINGKMRGTITIAPNASETEAMEAVGSSEELSSRIAGQEVKKIIYVPGRILNIIVG